MSRHGVGVEGGVVGDLLGEGVAAALRRAQAFLEGQSVSDLLGLVGRTIPDLSLTMETAGKQHFPASYGGGGSSDEDLLAARGLFYVTQSGRLMLDATAGHYQMTWGYAHPVLHRALREAMDLGVVWDNHSNIPGPPVKTLAEKLLAAAGNGLDRVLLGICTGSVACSTALKIMLARYRADAARSHLGIPVMISLKGNYHGTDIAAQALRGMWPGLVTGMVCVQVEPNDTDDLERVFRQYGGRVAGFWAEPVMMNCEGTVVGPAYLRRARDLCTHHGALMALDEIQTGFWCPELFYFRRLHLTPDFVIVGKGMSAGFHPLAAVLYRGDLDILEQYDAISTNGNASLASLISLCSIRMIEDNGRAIDATAARLEDGLRALAAEFPTILQGVTGAGYLRGLKFRDRGRALAFHQASLDRGLWLRVHAYHEGHRTILMKLPLIADESVVDYLLGALRAILRST